jgi:hypothetical protein
VHVPLPNRINISTHTQTKKRKKGEDKKPLGEGMTGKEKN